MASIKQRPNGKWRARYRDDDGREHAQHFDRKRDAQEWLNDVSTSRRTGSWVDPRTAKTTLEAFYAAWAPRQVWAPSTRRAMDLALDGCTFKDVPFGKLRRSHAEAWVKAMDAKLAPTTIRTRFKNVQAALRAAVRDRELAADPCEGVTLPRRRRTEHAMRIPSTEYVGKAVNAAEPWFATFIALCAFAGLRSGEAAAVQAGDIAWTARKLHVRRQAQWSTGTVLIVPPKHGSERTVDLPNELVTMLSRHVGEIGVRGEAGWLFGSTHWTPPAAHVMLHHWNRLTDSLGLERHRVHDLRHFYASALIAAGCDVVTVQRAMGHANAATTLGTYSHLWPSAEDRTRAAAADLMRTSLGAPADRVRTEQG